MPADKRKCLYCVFQRMCQCAPTGVPSFLMSMSSFCNRREETAMMDGSTMAE